MHVEDGQPSVVHVHCVYMHCCELGHEATNLFNECVCVCVCLFPFRWCPVLLCHLLSVQGAPFRAVQGHRHGHEGAVQGLVGGEGRGW